MTLRQKQARFAVMVAELILWCRDNGFEVTFGEAYRTQDQAELNARRGIGIANSLHRERLAVDLNVFHNGVWLTTDAALSPLHDYWESIGGAVRISGDAGHFSLAHGGRR